MEAGVDGGSRTRGEAMLQPGEMHEVAGRSSQPHSGPSGRRRHSFLLRLMGLFLGKNKHHAKKTRNDILCERKTFAHEMQPLESAGAGARATKGEIMSSQDKAPKTGGIVRVSHKDVPLGLEVEHANFRGTGQSPTSRMLRRRAPVGVGLNTRALGPEVEIYNPGRQMNKPVFPEAREKRSEVGNAMRSALYRPALAMSTAEKSDADSVSTWPVSNVQTMMTLSRPKEGAAKKDEDEIHTAAGMVLPGSGRCCSHRMADSVQSIAIEGFKTPKSGTFKPALRTLHRSRSDIDLSEVQRALDGVDSTQLGMLAYGERNEKLNDTDMMHPVYVASERFGRPRSRSRWGRCIKRVPLLRSLVGSEGLGAGEGRASTGSQQQKAKLCMKCFRSPTTSIDCRREDAAVGKRSAIPPGASPVAPPESPSVYSHFSGNRDMPSTLVEGRMGAFPSFNQQYRSTDRNVERSLSLDAGTPRFYQALPSDAEVTPTTGQGVCEIWEDSTSMPGSSVKPCDRSYWLPPVFKSDQEYASRQLGFHQDRGVCQDGVASMTESTRSWRAGGNLAAPSKVSVDESAWDECSIPGFDVRNVQWVEPDGSMRRSISFSDFGIESRSSFT